MTYHRQDARIMTYQMRANGGTIRVSRHTQAERVLVRMEQDGQVEFVERNTDGTTTYRFKLAMKTETQPSERESAEPGEQIRMQQLEPTEIKPDTPLGRLYQQYQDATGTHAAVQDKLAHMEARGNAMRHWLATTTNASVELFTRKQADLMLLDRELLGVRRAADRALEVYTRIQALWIQRYGAYANAIKLINGDTALHRPTGQGYADLLAEIRTAVGADEPDRQGG